MTQAHVKRIEKLQAAMAAANVDAIFLYSEINRNYFTGLTTSNGLLLVEQQGMPVFYTDFRYIEVANRVLKGIEIRKFKPAKEQLADYSAAAASWKTIGYEGNLTVAQVLPLQEAMAGAKWVSISTMSLDIWGSTLPVGSSAMISAGWLAKARARPTRCCSPPDNEGG